MEAVNKTPEVINRFIDGYFYLSNFYEIPVFYKGKCYENSEAAFQAQKCPERADEFINLAPGPAKRLGRKVLLRADWDAVKDQIMYEVVYAKFSQHVSIFHALMNTGNATLIEGNTWNDTYWGICNGIGQNKLGQILMKVREELTKKWLEAIS